MCRHRKSSLIPGPRAPPASGWGRTPTTLWAVPVILGPAYSPPPFANAPPSLLPAAEFGRGSQTRTELSCYKSMVSSLGCATNTDPTTPFSAQVGFFSIRLRGGSSSSPAFTSLSVNEPVSSLCARRCPKNIHNSSTGREIIFEIPILQMRNPRHRAHRPGPWRRQNLRVCSYRPSCGLRLENGLSGLSTSVPAAPAPAPSLHLPASPPVLDSFYP